MCLPLTNPELSSSWVVENEKNNVYDKILHFLRKNRMVITEKTQKKISAKQGSSLITSLLGTYLTPAIYLPKKVFIELEELEKETKIKVLIKEDIGLSELNVNLEHKYKNYINMWLEDLRGGLTP